MKSLRALALAPIFALVACGGDAPPPVAPVAPPTTAKPVASSAPTAADPLGDRPTPGMPPAFTPPTPVVAACHHC